MKRLQQALTYDYTSSQAPIYNQLVFKHVLGLNISGNTPARELGVPIEDAMRAIEDQAGQVISTGQFKNQCGSFLARPFDGCEPRKRNELYAKYGLGGWGDAVNDRWKEGKSDEPIGKVDLAARVDAYGGKPIKT